MSIITKQLDRAEKASFAAFWLLSHHDFVKSVRFCLAEDNHVWSTGVILCLYHAIPIGGSLSARCADLRSVWALFIKVSFLTDLSCSAVANSLWDFHHFFTVLRQ